MGVASSAESGSASPNKLHTSRSPTRYSPKRKVSPAKPATRTLGKSNAELGISGRKRSSDSAQENVRPSPAPSMSASSISSNMSMPMTTAAALYERPSKRPSAAPHVSLFADSIGDAAGAGGGGLPVSILLDEVVVGEEDDGGGGGGFDQAPELIMGTLAASMAKGVEQGEEKGLEERDAGISRGGSGGGGVPDSILLGEAVVDEEDDGGGGGGFDQARELIMGTLAASMAKGVKQWEQKGPEQRDAAVRLVIEDLCLPTRDGVKQKRQLDEELIRRVLAAMNFLAGIYDVKRGAHVMARRVWKVRHTIHVIAVDMSRSHCKLFPDGYPNAASSSDDDDDDGGFSLGPCLTADGFLGSAPGRRRKQLPGQHEIGKDCRPRSSDGPAAVGCCFKNPFCPPDMLVAEMARAKGGTCEWKESFEGAVANCQSVLKNATNEEEWLQSRREGVVRSAKDVEDDTHNYLSQQRAEIEKWKEKVHDAARSVGEATHNAIQVPSSDSSVPGRDALRCVVDPCQQSQSFASGREVSEERRGGIVRKTMAENMTEASLELQTEHTSLVEHAANISGHLGNMLFGHLLNTISRVRQRVWEKVKVSSEAVFSTYQLATEFHVDREIRALDYLQIGERQLKEVTQLHGEEAPETLSLREEQEEMKGFAVDSAKRLHDMSAMVEQLCIQLQQALPKGDYDVLTKGVKEFTLRKSGALEMAERARMGCI